MIDTNKENIIELYKLQVEMADRVIQRANQTEKFYIALLSIILIISFTLYGVVMIEGNRIFIFLTGILGLLLCFIWRNKIISYRLLNSTKFELITEMEDQLPLPFMIYTREFNKLLSDFNNQDRYVHLSKISDFCPLFFFMILYFLLIIFSII